MRGANEALETSYINRGKWKLEASDEPLDVVIEHAMNEGALKHFNDGPRGGIWVVTPEREEIAVALQGLPNSEWQFLGLGVGRSERCVFMLHKLGSGGPESPRDAGNGGSQWSDPGPNRTFSIKSLKTRVNEVKTAAKEGNKKEGLFKKLTRKVREAFE